MAQFEINYANKPVNVQATAAPLKPQTQVYEAISQVGQSVFQIGAELQERQDTLDYSLGQRKISELFNVAMGLLTGNEKNDTQIRDKLQQDIDSVQFGNNRVNSALSVYRNRALPEIQNSLNNRHKTLLRQNQRDEFETLGQSYLVKGDLTSYQDILDRRLATQDISQAEYDALSKSAFSDSLIEQSRDLSASNRGEDQKKALMFLDSISEMKALDLSTEQKEDVQKLHSVILRNQNVLAQEANKELTDLMLDGQISSEAVKSKRNELGDEDYQQWARIALEPIDKRGNVVETTRLKTLAIDVWRGSLNRQEAEKEIRKSLMDPNGINDKQYAAIYEDLNREVRSYQAQDIKTYSMETTRLILGKDAGVMTFDVNGNMSIDINKLLSPQDEFEKKMHYIDLYTSDMNNYLAENPTASKKELYIKSQELKTTYLAASKGQAVTKGLSPEKEKRRQELLRKARGE
jgi:hypothetical protein